MLPERPRYCPRCGAPLDGEACARDGYRWYADPKVAVGVLARDAEGRLLLVQRNHEPALGAWAFPSGYVDAGERLEDAAVREVREEAGAEVRLTGLIGAWSEEGVGVVFLAYAGTYVSGTVQAGEEAERAGWFRADALPPLAFPHDDEIVQAWRRGDGTPVRGATQDEERGR